MLYSAGGFSIGRGRVKLNQNDIMVSQYYQKIHNYRNYVLRGGDDYLFRYTKYHVNWRV